MIKQTRLQRFFNNIALKKMTSVVSTSGLPTLKGHDILSEIEKGEVSSCLSNIDVMKRFKRSIQDLSTTAEYFKIFTNGDVILLCCTLVQCIWALQQKSYLFNLKKNTKHLANCKAMRPNSTYLQKNRNHDSSSWVGLKSQKTQSYATVSVSHQFLFVCKFYPPPSKKTWGNRFILSL